MQLSVTKLCKAIKGVTVLNNIDLEFQGGRSYGLRGPNGCGKTMLMRAMCGLVRASSGSVSIDGQTLGRDISFPPSVGALIENPSFISKYTGFENLKLLAMIQDKISDADIATALEQVGLDADDKRTYKKYSLGMKQRLGIAAAIMESPELILLDEPINALDEAGVVLIRELLLIKKQEGALLVIACHDTQELELLVDEVYEMAEGKIQGHYLVANEGHV